MDFEIKLIFLIEPFFLHDQKVMIMIKVIIKYLENEVK